MQCSTCRSCRPRSMRAPGSRSGSPNVLRPSGCSWWYLHIFAPEHLELLLNAVLEHLKSRLRSLGQQLAVLIDHARVQHNQVCISPKRRTFTRGWLWFLPEAGGAERHDTEQERADAEFSH